MMVFKILYIDDILLIRNNVRIIIINQDLVVYLVLDEGSKKRIVYS